MRVTGVVHERASCDAGVFSGAPVAPSYYESEDYDAENVCEGSI